MGKYLVNKNGDLYQPAKPRSITMGVNRSGFLKWLTVAGALLAIVSFGSISDAFADDSSQKPQAAANPPIKAKKPMKMNQPMRGEMKKEGMMKGDVKKAAAKKQKDMKDVMEKEQQAMPPDAGKK
jgi:hypothetical protein